MKNRFYFNCLLLIIVILVNNYECKSQVTHSNIENNPEDMQATKSAKILDYTFKDASDKNVRISDFRGKFVIVDIWFTGCGACIMVNDALKTVHDSLRNENVVFLSISIDKNKAKWIQSITKNAHPSTLNNWAGQYCPATGAITLYTGGSGSENDFIKKYVPSGFYPQLLIISPTGDILSSNPPRPDQDPKLLIDYIRHFL